MKNFFIKIKDYFKNIVIPMFSGIQWLEIPITTYVRWILTFVVSFNTVFTYLGFNPIPISETDVYMIVSVILNIIVLIINTYKNNSTSKEALIADKLLRALKAASTTNKDTAIEKLQDILKELNGDDYISSDHTNNKMSIEESSTNSTK